MDNEKFILDYFSQYLNSIPGSESLGLNILELFMNTISISIFTKVVPSK